MQIIVEPLVFDKMRELVQALLAKGYFAMPESAEKYVLKVYDAIKALPRLQFRKTSEISSGNFYATYKPNRNTTWYILFDKEGDRYIVRNLINNHTPDYPKFIASLK